MFQDFRETQKDTWYDKNCDHVNILITYMFTGLEHEKKDKVQVPQWNEMVSLYCTAQGLISKNEEYNPKENIPNSK